MFDARDFVAKLIDGTYDLDLHEQVRRLSYDQLEMVEYLVEKHLNELPPVADEGGRPSSQNRWGIHRGNGSRMHTRRLTHPPAE